MISALTTAVLTTTSALADTIHVPGDQPTIQAGINAAVDGDEVVVADGTYTGDGNRDMHFGTAAITVRSANGAADCIIDLQADENDPHRAFDFTGGQLAENVVEGFTIRNGFGDGAAIFGSGGGPIIRRCVLRDSAGGSAIHVAAGPLFLVVEECQFIDNASGAVLGAGIGGGKIRLTNCLFVGNGGDGALRGGGRFTTIEVTNCTFFANSASNGDGGAIQADVNCDEDCHNCFVHISVRNSIVWGNTPLQLSIGAGCNNINVSYGNVEGGGWNGAGNIDADPLFVDPDRDDFRLSAGSPCIDAGNNTNLPCAVTEDLGGNPRFVDDPDTDDTGVGD
ncbi:MAG: right-handed parallel beta-helix repeat-containing protein, partial [Planctomycetota bacterium]